MEFNFHSTNRMLFLVWLWLSLQTTICLSICKLMHIIYYNYPLANLDHVSLPLPSLYYSGGSIRSIGPSQAAAGLEGSIKNLYGHVISRAIVYISHM